MAAPFSSLVSASGYRRLGVEQLAVSIKEAGKTLSVGRTTIYEMIADGRLEAFRLGRRRLVKVESIRRLIATQA